MEAEKYAEAVGRLPKGLRTLVETFWVHDGLNPFGGGNRNLLIHTKQGENYITNGILDETFMHEAAHTSLDPCLYGTDEWNTAVEADNKFVSDYARDNPQREDIAESYLVWFATRYKQDQFTAQELSDWEAQQGNRF